MKINSNKLIENLKTKMAERGFSPSSLAYACGLQPSTVLRLLSGDSVPRASTLAVLAIALEVSIQELAGLDIPADNRPPRMVANKRLPLITGETALSFCSDDEEKADSVLTAQTEPVVWVPGTPSEKLNYTASFCMIAEEDALYPDIKKGDYLYFRRPVDVAELRSGHVVLACTSRRDTEAEVVVRQAFSSTHGIYLRASESMQTFFPSIYLPFDRSEDGIGVIGLLAAKLSVFD